MSGRGPRIRWFAVGFVLTSMSLFALGACGEGGAAPSNALVTFEISGGIVGFADHLSIRKDGQVELIRTAVQDESRTFRLSSSELRRLRSLLQQTDFGSLQSEYSSSGVADEIHYAITYSERTIEADGSAIPEGLGPLVGFLSKLDAEHRAPLVR